MRHVLHGGVVVDGEVDDGSPVETEVDGLVVRESAVRVAVAPVVLRKGSGVVLEDGEDPQTRGEDVLEFALLEHLRPAAAGRLVQVAADVPVLVGEHPLAS